jgi:hypoxanthine phosphoribosyltransferase
MDENVLTDRQPETSTTKYNLAWSYYFRLINKLYQKINWDTEEFDYIVSINRGGNIIGTILSHKTRLPLIVMNKEEVPEVRGKILIVDDISDTGRTLLKVISNLKTGTSYKTATLHIQNHTHHRPDYYVSTVKQWIIYPYERVHKKTETRRRENGNKQSRRKKRV